METVSNWKTWVEKRWRKDATKTTQERSLPVCARLTARKSKDLWHDITHCSDHGYPATTINSEWFAQSENCQNTVGEAVNKPCTVDFNPFVVHILRNFELVQVELCTWVERAATIPWSRYYKFTADPKNQKDPSVHFCSPAFRAWSPPGCSDPAWHP